jgi:hypothetical protein
MLPRVVNRLGVRPSGMIADVPGFGPGRQRRSWTYILRELRNPLHGPPQAVNKLDGLRLENTKPCTQRYGRVQPLHLLTSTPQVPVGRFFLGRPVVSRWGLPIFSVLTTRRCGMARSHLLWTYIQRARLIPMRTELLVNFRRVWQPSTEKITPEYGREVRIRLLTSTAVCWVDTQILRQLGFGQMEMFCSSLDALPRKTPELTMRYFGPFQFLSPPQSASAYSRCLGVEDASSAIARTWVIVNLPRQRSGSVREFHPLE